jgi:Helix-turn-helix.
MAARPLNHYRESLYLNVDEFVKYIDISLQTYYRILAGERTRFTTMRKIAKKLGVHPSDISEFEIKHPEDSKEA